MAGNGNEGRPSWKLRGCGSTIRAIGFDLGDTLVFYADTPLSWSSLYSEALSCVAEVCDATPSAEDVHRAQEILTSYNTRLTPRTHEVAASTILREILEAWRVDPDGQQYVHKVCDAGGRKIILYKPSWHSIRHIGQNPDRHSTRAKSGKNRHRYLRRCDPPLKEAEERLDCGMQLDGANDTSRPHKTLCSATCLRQPRK